MFRTPSGSKLDLAVTCAASTVLPEVQNINDKAERGTVAHDYIRNARNEGRDKALEAVPAEYRDFCAALDVEAIRSFSEEIAEAAYGYNILTGEVRYFGPNIGRNYPELAPEWVCLSLDLVGLEADGAFVLDYKTGLSVKAARRNWQLRLGSLVVSVYHRRSRVAAALVYTREGQNYWDKAEFSSFDLDSFAAELRLAYQRWTKESVLYQEQRPLSYVTGEHCRYCPSISYCKAQTSLLSHIAVGDQILARLTPETAASAYLKIREYKAAIGAAEKLVETYAKAHPIPLGDGTYYGLVEGGGRDELDGETVQQVLGSGAVTVEVSATQAGIKAHAKKHAAETGRPASQVEKEMLEAVKAAGGIRRRSFAPRVREFTRREEK